MAAAFEGPTPGNSASTAAGAVFRLTTPSIPLAARAGRTAMQQTTRQRPQGQTTGRTPGFRPAGPGGCHWGEQKAVCVQGVADSAKPPLVPVGRQT